MIEIQDIVVLFKPSLQLKHKKGGDGEEEGLRFNAGTLVQDADMSQSEPGIHISHQKI